jgi:ribosomal protein S27AE
MIEDFYKLESEESLKKDRPLCPHCKEKLRYRIQKPQLVKIFLFFLPLKRYRCINCRQSVYVFK